jgi:hypothetical protein
MMSLFNFLRSKRKEKKKLLLIQPGRFGDIIICLPIAKFYHSLGYSIIWPISEHYTEIFRNIDYEVPL